MATQRRPDDVVARVGFTGALQALRMPDCFALLVPSREHMSAVEPGRSA
jgi:hypothetical protein